jgi:phosphorylcholine metabolism protein LicD
MGKEEIDAKIPYQMENEQNKANHMHELKEIFDELGIPFMLGYGLVLSYVRNKRFIFNDGDIDFIVKKEDIKGKESALLQKLVETEHVNFRDFGDENRLWCNKDVNGYSSEFDLYVYPKHEVWRYEYFHKFHKYLMYPKEPFENPLKVTFYGKEYLIPNPPEEYVRTVYGTNWRIPFTPPRGTEPKVFMSDHLLSVKEFVKLMESVEDT